MITISRKRISLVLQTLFPLLSISQKYSLFFIDLLLQLNSPSYNLATDRDLIFVIVCTYMRTLYVYSTVKLVLSLYLLTFSVYVYIYYKEEPFVIFESFALCALVLPSTGNYGESMKRRKYEKIYVFFVLCSLRETRIKKYSFLGKLKLSFMQRKKNIERLFCKF